MSLLLPLPRLRARDGHLSADLQKADAGDLGLLPARLLPETTADLICGFCSTGCSLRAHIRDGESCNLTPTPGYPVNQGTACPKGWQALAPLRAADRARTPLLREGGIPRPVDWPTALRVFVAEFRRILDVHGPDSVAFLGTGQIPTEEIAFLGTLAKFGMGLRHGDGNTRQCMASAVAAYRESFGFDAPPYTYADLEASDLIVFVGANPCIAHPILWHRVLRNPHRPEVVVIDPRRTETAMAATRHYAPRPKSDLVLFHGIAHLLLRNGWIDRSFVEASTEGLDELTAAVAPYTPARVAAETGIPAHRIEELARLVARARRASFWWTMGVNQSHQGVRTAQAIINVALLTGNIGKPGTGACSITGQANAMGSRLFSNTSSLLGGRDFASAADRREVARILGIPETRIPSDKGWSYEQIVDAVRAGTIRGLWIVATNPAHSWIDRSRFDDDVLGRLDFLVVQDMYATTETARQAHLLLPAAGWGEKDGTFINSERRIGVVRKVARPPGQALTDFAIFRLLAQAWGCEAMFRRWQSPEQTFFVLRELSRGMPCDFTGIEDYAMLERAGGIQWPYPAADPPRGGERRLFEDGRFYRPSGRALFVFGAPAPLPERPDGDYPLLLLTGRGSSAQWHTQTRTAKSEVLRRLSPAEPEAHVHPDDARALGICEGGWVRVESRRGSSRARARLTVLVRPGHLFLAMHDAGTNRLTFPAFDPISRQPAYKAAAVRVVPEPEPRGTGRPTRAGSGGRH